MKWIRSRRNARYQWRFFRDWSDPP